MATTNTGMVLCADGVWRNPRYMTTDALKRHLGYQPRATAFPDDIDPDYENAVADVGLHGENAR